MALAAEMKAASPCPSRWRRGRSDRGEECIWRVGMRGRQEELYERKKGLKKDDAPSRFATHTLHIYDDNDDE